MKSKLAKNYLYTLIYQILIVFLPIVTMPYLSRVLGAENIGIYGYTISIVSYFTLLCGLGITKYGQREIAYAQDDRKKRSRIFWELNLIKLISVILFSIVFYVFFCLGDRYSAYFKILLFEIIAVFFDITWFFQGLEDFKKVVIRNSIIKTLSILAIFLFIKSEADLVYYYIIYVASNLLGNLSLWIKIKKYVDKPDFRFVKLRRHLRPMFSLFIPQIAISIYTVLDKTMLGNLTTDVAEVGYYEQSQKIIKIAMTLVTTLSIVMMPRISNVYSKNNKEQIDKYMNISFRFNWMLGCAIMFGIAATAPLFVPWFFGGGFEKVIDLLVYTSPIIVIIAFSSTIGSQLLVSIKKQNIQTLAVVSGAIINVILNFLLIPQMKSVGAVLATLVAELAITVIEVIYVIRHRMVRRENIFNYCHAYLFAGLVMFLAIRLSQALFKSSILTTAIQVFTGVIIYCGILLLLKDDFFWLIIKSGKRIIKRGKK